MAKIKKQIFYKMVLSSVLVLLVVFLLIFGYNYNINMSLLKKHAINENYNKLELIAEKIDKYIETINLVTSFAYEADVQNLLRRQADETDIEQMRRLRNFQDFYYKRLISLDFEGEIQDIYFIYPDGEVLHKGNGIYLPDYDFTRQDWFTEAIHSTPNLFILDTHDQPYNQPQRYAELEKHEKFISVVKSIGSSGDLSLRGVLMMDINVERFTSMIGPLLLGKESKVYFTDAGGKILYSDMKAEIDSQIPSFITEKLADPDHTSGKIDNQDYVVTYLKSESTGWYLVNMNPTDLMIQDVMAVQQKILLISAFAVLGTVLLVVIFARRIFRPIEALALAMKEVEKGELDLQVPVASDDEIGYLTKSFNQMLQRIRALIRDNYLISLKEKDAQIESLELQINPHFLYNTLESVNCIAKIREVEEISIISNSLADMFRYSTSNAGRMVRVSEEVEHIKNYLNIQQIRFGNFFSVRYAVAEDAADGLMIPLILQPLVENALKYNIEEAGRRVEIHIRIMRNNEQLHFCITDNGVGFSEERLAQIKAGFKTKDNYLPDGKKKHIGLQNIHRRLQLHYGDEYGLMIESVEREYTKVSFAVPVTGQI